LKRSRPNRRECLTLSQKRTSRTRSKNGGDVGIGVYIWEGTNSRMMAADRSYGKFYDFYSVSPEYFGYSHVVLIEYNTGNSTCAWISYSEFEIFATDTCDKIKVRLLHTGVTIFLRGFNKSTTQQVASKYATRWCYILCNFFPKNIN
jgi:hypothetical protein